MRYILGISMVMLMAYSCKQDFARMDAYSVHGIDVSHYQAAINWDTVASQDLNFAFVKASEGYSLVDTLFCHNWEEIKRVGLKRGAYHFFRPTISAAKQAELFTNWVELDYGDLPPVLDIEVLDGVSKVALISAVREWLFIVEIKYNIKPIIYTNLKFYNRYLAGHFDNYPVWIARYNEKREPRLACGRDWDFWQYGNTGRIPGIKGNVDFNVFNGTMLDLEEMSFAPSAVLSSK